MEEKTGNSKAIATTTGTNPFRAYADAVAPRTIVGTLLKFQKGDFLSGEANEVVAEGTEFTVLLNETIVGWVKWGDGKPIEHRMGRIADRYVPPVRKDLDDIDKMTWEEEADGKLRDPWQFTNYVPMKREPGGELYTFVAASKGSLGAVGDLCREYARHAEKHGEQNPIVRLASDTYEHRIRAYGKIPFPIFTIVGWAAKEELDPVASPPDPSDDPEELPF